MRPGGDPAQAGNLVDVGTLAACGTCRPHAVELTFEGSPPELEGVAGVKVLSQVDGRLRCNVTGPMGPLIDALHDSKLVTMVSEEPSLGR